MQHAARNLFPCPPDSRIAPTVPALQRGSCHADAMDSPVLVFAGVPAVRGRPGLRQRPGHPPAPLADRQRDAHRLRVCQQHLGGRAGRRHGAPADQLPGADGQPALLAGRQIVGLQRRVRGQRGRLRRAGPRGRAQAAHVAPGRRHRPGVVARRQARALHLVPSLLGAERRAPVLDGAGRGRRRGSAPTAARLPGQDLSRRPPHRLPHEQLLGRGAAQLPWRAEPAHLDRGPRDVRPGDAALDGFEGRGSRVGAGHRLLHLGSRRRGQRVVLRAEDEAAGAGHDVRRLRRQGARRGSRGRGLRAGGLRPRARPEVGQVARRPDHGGRRFPVDDAALGRRDQPDDQRRPVADGQARGDGGPRRDLHGARREGRRPQPDALQRFCGAPAGVVARRQVRVVLQRQVGGVHADDRGAGRPDPAARDRPREPDLLLHAVLVTRLEEDPLHRHEAERLGARRGHGQGEGGRPRPVDGAAADAAPLLEPRLEVGGVRQPPAVALPGDLRGQRGYR